jgi:hypothetical protein
LATLLLKNIHTLVTMDATRREISDGALIFCHPQRVDLSVINGKVVVRDGVLQTMDLPMLVEQHNAISRHLIRGE